MKQLQDQHVLVLGLGISGMAMARFCARHGARVRVWDSREQAPGDDALSGIQSSSPVERLRGDLIEASLDGVHLVLKSPGLAPNDARVAALWQAAGARGLARQGELDLFARALSHLQVEHGYAPKVVAITGTNGKTTTTALTTLLIERSGLRVATAGNIGPSMLDVLTRECLDEQDHTAWPAAWVLELSSFQLDGVVDFEPTAATVLNVTQDHLDWHGTMDAYAAAKSRVFGSKAVMVINRDDPMVQAMAVAAEEAAKQAAKDAAKLAVKAQQPSEDGTAPSKADRLKLARSRRGQGAYRKVVRFGLDAPRSPGEFGLVVEGGMTWLVGAHDDSAGGLRHDSDVLIQRLMPADALRIRGRHNAANALAAIALVTAIGCPMTPILHGLRDYKGEPHRVESIAVVQGVEAIDDSKGTNVGATVAAIEGLGIDRAPAKLVMILGGDGKGQDFAPLAAPLAKHARAIALIGRDAARVAAAIDTVDVAKVTHDTLEEATRWCFEQAKSGDAVVMSPACASLDMFRNYTHRAEVFAAVVQAVASERGEVTA